MIMTSFIRLIGTRRASRTTVFLLTSTIHQGISPINCDQGLAWHSLNEPVLHPNPPGSTPSSSWELHLLHGLGLGLGNPRGTDAKSVLKGTPNRSRCPCTECWFRENVDTAECWYRLLWPPNVDTARCWSRQMLIPLVNIGCWGCEMMIPPFGM